MAQTKTKQTYTTLRPFAHGGRVVPTGGRVSMHPKQAKYLLGSHLTDKKPTSKAAAKTPTKTTTKGDQ